MHPSRQLYQAELAYRHGAALAAAERERRVAAARAERDRWAAEPGAPGPRRGRGGALRAALAGAVAAALGGGAVPTGRA